MGLGASRLPLRSKRTHTSLDQLSKPSLRRGTKKNCVTGGSPNKGKGRGMESSSGFTKPRDAKAISVAW
jgi:hypothetical protein